jgi:hypothetical protein
MTRPIKRERLAAMRLEEFKAHLRTIAGGSSEEITGAPRPQAIARAQSQEGSPSAKEKEALSHGIRSQAGRQAVLPVILNASCRT